MMKSLVSRGHLLGSIKILYFKLILTFDLEKALGSTSFKLTNLDATICLTRNIGDNQK
jgi:hypothetical protein